MIKLTKQQKANLIMLKLKEEYPIVITPLIHKNAFELLIATMLSPQTLDSTTNKVTKVLFEKYPDVTSLSNAKIEDIEKVIRIVNYHKTKAKNLIKASNILIKDFDGRVPHTLKELTLLPGVGRKVANVVISEWFAKDLYKRGSPILSKEKVDSLDESEKIKVLPEGFVIDTHVLRTSQRLGLTKHKTPKEVEKDLMDLFPREEWNDMSLRLIFHGRNRCKARYNKCCEDEFWAEVCDCY